MTIVVLLLIVGIWLVVLGPGFLRRRAENHSVDSIGKFHRQLGVLQRTGPALVPPAHRLRASSVPAPAGLPFVSPRSGLLVVRPDAEIWTEEDPAAVRRPDPYFRPHACKRRRDVLMALGAGVVLCALMGAVSSVMLLLAGVLAAVAVGYLALLVHLRRLAVEREAKLRYLPRHQPADLADGAAEPMRRVAAR